MARLPATAVQVSTNTPPLIWPDVVGADAGPTVSDVLVPISDEMEEVSVATIVQVVVPSTGMPSFFDVAVNSPSLIPGAPFSLCQIW